ncbi:MAG: hypothetical protein DLM72_18860 [Candidatus Nitrosopolaris wilkensis]|nr:MAG: hypothetical protein DLM72_18860 [Candidatus Nitrosopolaris wilkensis]
MKKLFSVAICLTLVLSLIFSAPAGLLLSNAKAQNSISSLPKSSLLTTRTTTPNPTSTTGNNNLVGSASPTRQSPIQPGTADAIPNQVPGNNPLFSPALNPNQQGGRNPPIAEAGSNLVVSEGSRVMLDGSKSHDANPGGSIAFYRWMQTSGIPVSLFASNTANPTFIAPQLPIGTAPAVLTFSLSVSDSYGLTGTNPSSTSVTVSYNPQFHYLRPTIPFSASSPNAGQPPQGPLVQQYPFSQFKQPIQQRQQVPQVTGNKVVTSAPPNPAAPTTGAKQNNTLQRLQTVPNNSVQVPTTPNQIIKALQDPLLQMH